MSDNHDIYGQPFTEERIELAAKLWARSSISLIDVRKYTLHPDEPLSYYRLPTSALICTWGAHASVNLDRLAYQVDRSGIFHGGRGSELSIYPHAQPLDVYLVLYKADSAPFYRRDLHRLLDRFNPFHQLFGYVPANPIGCMERFSSMAWHWRQNTAVEQLYAKAGLYQIMHHLYAELQQGGVRLAEPDLVDSVKRYLDRHYRAVISIQGLIEQLPVSRSQLVRQFKKREGMSFQEYLNVRRVEAAEHYLLRSQATIQEVALGCGFGDELNLLRMFKKYKQMTPSEYRSKMKGDWNVLDMDNHSQRYYNEGGLAQLANLKEDGELSMLGRTRSKEMVLAAAVSIMLLLSACTANAPVNNTTTSSNTGSSQSQTAPSTESAKTSQAESTAQTRIVKTADGDIEVPADPQRIVYLVGNNYGDVLPFGKTVVGVDIYGDPSKRPASWNEQWGAQIDGISLVGIGDLEGILDLDPDLIIGSHTWAFATKEQLEKIAPTIFYNEMAELEERITFFGEVFGMTEEADAFIAEYAVAAEAAKQRLRDADMYDKKIVFVQDVDAGTPGLQGDKTRGVIYDDLGMQAPDAVEREFLHRGNPDAEGYYSPISMEILGEYLQDADMIAYMYFGEDTEQLEMDLSADEIWNSIPAVQAGNVLFYSVSDTLSDFDYASRMVSLESFVDRLLEM